ncbi:MAG TPA: T9SS type A sorting domain-containing protein, partial [Bacteroidia bacterium]|nr:T9SS type A sorting domain-containing protein [Bacteroidia bacterium]
DTTWTGFTATFTATSNSPNSTYTWNFGDTGTGSGATVTHMYTIPGIMDGQVIINTGGCSDTINQTVVVMLTTGVIAPMPLSFQLMPNPTNGEILITTKENNEKLVTVTNLLGQTISSEILTGNKVSVDLTGQAPGIYLVEVRDKVTQKSGVKKIVLQ